MGTSVAAIIYHKKKYFLQKRDNKKTIIFPNHLSLFGGMKEKSESCPAAMRRELFEEINIRFKDINNFFTYEITTKKLKYKRKRIYFLCTLPNNFEKSLDVKEGQYGKFYDIKNIDPQSIVPWDYSVLIYHQKISKNIFFIK
jgi:8-oxo-dGTP pyrophosphatase MutT (NUDIX family)